MCGALENTVGGRECLCPKDHPEEGLHSRAITTVSEVQAPSSDDKINQGGKKKELSQSEFFLIRVFEVRTFQPKGFHFCKMNWIRSHLRT